MPSRKNAEAVAYFRRLLEPVYRDRKLLHVSEVDAAMFGTASMLAELGAANPFLLAGNKGTTKARVPNDAEVCTLELRGATIVETARRFERLLQDLPQSLVKRINHWDPNMEARSVGVTLGEFTQVAGREKYGRRKSDWTNLEDKTTIDRFWDYVGTERAQSKVVSLHRSNLEEIANDLDVGLGTVWAADNSAGVHGGSTGLRWLESSQTATELVDEMSDFAENVRVAPFLEGIPMSIHGVVLANQVAVFRPVELITLRYVERNQFLWAGCSTSYDPHELDRLEMRRIAREVGIALRDSVGYRGPFSIDGILTESGFLPTELNPRLSGGFGALTRGIPGLPLAPLCWAAMEEEPLNYRPALLEQAILESADTNRVTGGHVVTTRRFEQLVEIKLVRDGEEFREALPGENPIAWLTCGPSPVGGIIFLQMAGSSERNGMLIAPEMVRVLRYCDHQFNTGFGQLNCAKEVR